MALQISRSNIERFQMQNFIEERNYLLLFNFVFENVFQSKRKLSDMLLLCNRNISCINLFQWAKVNYIDSSLITHNIFFSYRRRNIYIY